MLMSHTGGLSYLDKPISLLELHHNPEKVEKELAKENPKWPPGTEHSYHAMTFGAYVDRVLSRADPKKRRIDQLFREEISIPFGIDFHIGLPRSEAYRAARFVPIDVAEFMWNMAKEPSMWNVLMTMMFDPRSRLIKASKAMKEQMERSGRRRYQCNECDATFSQSGRLALHKRRVHHQLDMEKYKCDFCNKVFTTKFSKERHERNRHFGEKTFQCDDCNTMFNTKYQLVGHMRSKHHHERLKCNSCDKTFSFESSLKEHDSICHKKKKEEACNSCDAKFTTKRALNVHKISTHEGKMCICELCGKSYHHESSLDRHKREKH